MPEMPELTVLVERLGPRVAGRPITGVTVSPKFGFLLRTPPADLARQLTGATVIELRRRGKFLVLEGGEQCLVINPMLGGRLQLSDAGDKKQPAGLFSIDFDGRDRVTLTDFARMARVYLVAPADLDSVPGWAELGPEASEIGLEEFRQRIRRHPGELKNLLRNQAFVAGIGNAYSDEVLHEARLLPLRKRSTLKPEEIDALHAAIGTVLNGAVEAIRAQPDYELHKQDRSFMKVHMHGGEPCPRCGHRIAEIRARGEITSYCRGCQK